MRKNFMKRNLTCAVLSAAMLISGGIAQAAQYTKDDITVPAASFPTLEGQSLVGWNGFDDWAGNTPSKYEKFMTATIEKDPEDGEKTFAEANKVMQFTLKGIYNTTGRPEGAITCDSNFHVNKILQSPLTGKVKVKTRLYNDSTEEGKAASFNFALGNEACKGSGSMEKRLINFEIAGADINVISNFGDSGQVKTTVKGVVPYQKWFELSTNIDTEAKTWTLSIDEDVKASGAFAGTAESVTLVAYSVDRSGNTAFKNSSNPDKMVKWYADDLYVQKYAAPNYDTMPTLNSKWENIASDNFESVTAPVTINDFASKYTRIKINSGVTGSYDRFQDVSIVRQNSNNILHMEQLTKLDAEKQNIRTFWRVFENGGNISDGAVKVSMRINGENSNNQSFYIYATKELTNWSSTAQYDPNNVTGDAQALGEIRIWGGDHIGVRSAAGDYTAYNTTSWNKNMGWVNLDIIYNLKLKKFTVWIDGKRVEFNGISEGKCPFYEGDNWNIGNIVLRVPRDQGGQTWLVDDIRVSVLDGWSSVECEDVTNVYADETDTLPSSLWSKTGTVVAAPNNGDYSDSVIKIKGQGEVSRAIVDTNGIITACADVLLSGTSADKSAYLADKDGNKMVSASLEGIPENTWTKVKLVCDMTERIYNVYLGENRVIANAPFGAENNGLFGKIGFACESGEMVVNNLLINRDDAAYNFDIKKLGFKDTEGEASSVPSDGGKVKTVTINNMAAIAENTSLFTAVYKDEVLYDVSVTAIPTNTAMGLSDISINEVNLPEQWDADCNVKVFCWNNSALSPICVMFSYR